MDICTLQNKMTKFKRVLMWIVLSAIGLLALLSVVGAFYGAQKSKLIFNSIPLGLYWCGFTLLFAAGFIGFTRLLRKPGLFMVHAGCLLILGGSMWGSEAGHRLAKRFFGIQKTPNGYMLISEGDSEKYITTEDFSQRLGELPFSIKLKDFRLEYYQTDEKQQRENPAMGVGIQGSRMIRDYFSDLAIIENGKEVLSKTIEVNRPLHYGGHHFYQYAYDSEMQKYTILSVTSDSGLYAVYAGYWMLVVGVLWQFWFRHIVVYILESKKNK